MERTPRNAKGMFVDPCGEELQPRQQVAEIIILAVSLAGGEEVDELCLNLRGMNLHEALEVTPEQLEAATGIPAKILNNIFAGLMHEFLERVDRGMMH